MTDLRSDRFSASSWLIDWLKTFRDLTADHIPMLENVLAKGAAAIEERYKVILC